MTVKEGRRGQVIENELQKQEDENENEEEEEEEEEEKGVNSLRT